MELGYKIKEKRQKAVMTQAALSSKLGITSRALFNYETGKRIPSPEVIAKLAEIFKTTTDYFLSTSDEFIIQAYGKYGAKGSRKAEELIAEASALFAGGELSEDDKDLFLQSMTKIYFESKERAKQKYTPKKYRKEDKED